MDKLTFQIEDDQYQAFMAEPKNGSGKGVLLFHPWWGLNADIGEFCQILADAGFVVLAPDYYRGNVVTTITEAMAYRNTLDRDYAKKIMLNAFTQFTALPMVKNEGLITIGFSLGAGFAIDLARKKNKKISGVVLFYGLGAGNLDKINAAFQGHFVENDPYQDADSVNRFRNKLEEAHRKYEFFNYPETEHWFMESGRPEYREQAAKLAWQRTIEFINTH